MADNTGGALAARIYSFLQKPVSSDAERKAAYAAWDLLSRSVPELTAGTAESGAQIIKKMAEQYLKLNPSPSPLSNLSQTSMIQLQNVMQKRHLMFEILSSMLKQQHEISKNVISNIR